MKRFLAAVRRLASADGGQDLVEYAMLAALIAVIAIGAISTLGQTIHNVLWQTIVNNF
jgi:Flp pilus assembly pilin Flp